VNVTVATNVRLKALSVPRAGTQIYRQGFAAAGDGGGVLYTYSSTNCSLNSRAGDNGSQVAPKRGGGCWNLSPSGAPVDLRVWGVQFDGSTDNSTTLAAAFGWWGQGNHLLVPGTSSIAYFSTPISVTLPNAVITASIEGAGIDLSMLGYTGTTGSGITVNYSSQYNGTVWRDFTYCASQAGGQTGLTLKQNAVVSNPALSSPNAISITMRGCSGYDLGQYFSIGIFVNGVSNVAFEGFQAIGYTAGGPTNTYAVDLFASSSTIGVIYNFHNSGIMYYQYGIRARDFTQGITISQSNFTAVSTSIKATTNSGTDQLTIADSQFQCFNALIPADHRFRMCLFIIICSS
jgi:hypothetical protein